jgi:DNA-binding NarL/FixJ family response regulator
VRVILAEDQVLLREGLVRLFGDLGHEVTSALGDATELESRIPSDNPDLVVLDIRMPPTHTDEGATAARAIKADRPDLGVLLLSQHVETGSTADLLGRPAFGYLLKDRVLDVREFVAACERVARGGSALDSKVVAALIASRKASPLTHLSERERQVLAQMAEGAEVGPPSEQLPKGVVACCGRSAMFFDVRVVPIPRLHSVTLFGSKVTVSLITGQWL